MGIASQDCATMKHVMIKIRARHVWLAALVLVLLGISFQSASLRLSLDFHHFPVLADGSDSDSSSDFERDYDSMIG